MSEGAVWKFLSLWTGHKPCLLVECNGIKILMDCAIDADSFSSFLPCSVVRSNRISWQKKVQPYGKDAIPILKQINEFVYAELMPEVRTIKTNLIDLTALDVILISNISSLIALPFLLKQNINIHCKIYATDPVIQLGKLIMEDLCDMFERVDRPSVDEWQWKNLSKNFQNPPTSEPEYWSEFFKRDEMEHCMNRIQHIFFNEEITLHNMLKITPHSSGYSIGSCNWLLQHNKQRIGYFSASSLRHSHPKSMELASFTQLDSLIITSLSTVDQSPDVTVYKFTTAVIETLKIGGNVLIPIVPTGLVYDLFECVLKAIEMNNLSRNIPVYFISTVAENSLEFANIFSEWLSDEKGSKVYKPEEPFYHLELVRSGRIRVFNSLYGAFSRECRQPCIVFTGHPSLRIGEVVHLLDFWGGNSRNAIMMVDPDYPLETYYSPFKSLSIRAYYFPIETRLDYNQLFNKVINDLSPKCVFFPEEYSEKFGTFSSMALPSAKFNHNQPIQLELGKQIKMKRIEDLKPISALAKKRKIKIDSEILKQMKLNVSTQALSPIQGQLMAREEDDISLGKWKEQKIETIKKIREKYGGKINVKILTDAMTKRELEVEMEETADEIIIQIKPYLANIRILNNGHRTIINCDDESHRRKIQSILHECLTKIGGGTETSKEIRNK